MKSMFGFVCRFPGNLASSCRGRALPAGPGGGGHHAGVPGPGRAERGTGGTAGPSLPRPAKVALPPAVAARRGRGSAA